LSRLTAATCQDNVLPPAADPIGFRVVENPRVITKAVRW
jgi:hypothetical protein